MMGSPIDPSSSHGNLPSPVEVKKVQTETQKLADFLRNTGPEDLRGLRPASQWKEDTKPNAQRRMDDLKPFEVSKRMSSKRNDSAQSLSSQTQGKKNTFFGWFKKDQPMQSARNEGTTFDGPTQFSGPVFAEAHKRISREVKIKSIAAFEPPPVEDFIEELDVKTAETEVQNAPKEPEVKKSSRSSTIPNSLLHFAPDAPPNVHSEDEEDDVFDLDYMDEGYHLLNIELFRNTEFNSNYVDVEINYEALKAGVQSETRVRFASMVEQVRFDSYSTGNL
jgi:hypothetical protein